MFARRLTAPCLGVLITMGCNSENEIALTKVEGAGITAEVSADGPKLASVASVTPVYQQPNRNSLMIGYLHAGALVARSEQAVGQEDCEAGWYGIHPRGFVCADGSATLDLQHPTVKAMSLGPKLDAPMPYTYARTRKDTPIYVVDSEHESSVRSTTKMPSRSGAAIVGSWQAKDESGQALRLAMLSDGRFLNAEHLEAAKFSDFEGVTLDKDTELPIGFVVKRGVRTWQLDGQKKAKKKDLLEYHAVLKLSGRFRTVKGEKFWALSDDENFVRHRDVTVARIRTEFPKFVTPQRKWIDISVITGTAVLYEGQRPVYTTLVSVGIDRLGDPANSDATARGEFGVLFKHISAHTLDPTRFANKVEMHDVPWTLELASKQQLHAAFWHNRFGIEHGPGNLQFSPADARKIFLWSDPQLPEGWHGVRASQDPNEQTIINVRK